MTEFRKATVFVAALLGSDGAAFCNNITGDMRMGGLTFAQANGIVMDSEELRIALDHVSVRYQLVNRSGKPQTVTVGFPLPDIDLSEPDGVALPAADPLNFVGSETKIDGRPAKLTFEQRAWIGDKDVSGLLNQLQFPLLPVGPREVRIADLPAATREKLLSNGLLANIGTAEGGHPIYGFAWTVKTSATRQQTFPADAKPVVIELRYKPIVGMTTDTILRKPLRQSKGLATEIARRAQDYCTTEALYAGVDRLAVKGAVQERRLNYVLHGGNHWAAPIGSFKLIVEPGNKDRLVSFCGNGLKPGASQPADFEASDFAPKSDLKFLILGKF